jgi:hypothetical protein
MCPAGAVPTTARAATIRAQGNDGMELTATLIFAYLALGGASLGLLQFGVGAMLWAEQKFLIAVGLLAALCGIYLGLMLLSLILNHRF